MEYPKLYRKLRADPDLFNAVMDGVERGVPPGPAMSAHEIRYWLYQEALSQVSIEKMDRYYDPEVRLSLPNPKKEGLSEREAAKRRVLNTIIRIHPAALVSAGYGDIREGKAFGDRSMLRSGARKHVIAVKNTLVVTLAAQMGARALARGGTRVFRGLRSLTGRNVSTFRAPGIQGGRIPSLRGNVPDGTKWIQGGGRVRYHVNGSMTYMKGGRSITYDATGFPGFTNHLYRGTGGLNQVQIDLTGSRFGDVVAANQAAGFSTTPLDYTWHHHQDPGLMQVVETEVHSQFWHTGGFSIGR